MIYALFIALGLLTSIFVFSDLEDSTNALIKYELIQKEKQLKSEVKIEKAIKRFHGAFGFYPSSHIELIASGFLISSDTSITSNRGGAIANKYQKALNQFVGDKSKTNLEIEKLFNAQTYGELPLEIKELVTDSEYAIMEASKLDFIVKDGVVEYTDTFKASELYARVNAVRASTTLSVNEDITSSSYRASNDRTRLLERRLEESIVTYRTIEDIEKIKNDLLLQNYSPDEIVNLVEIYENKRNDLNLSY